ncbi:hypothetical protein BDW72DRAFT_207533 [Aspergillus terricola var. indicus]
MSSILQANVYCLGEPGSSPISCTLIHDLAGWIKATAPGRDLRYVYFTHEHGDHWFGLTPPGHWPACACLRRQTQSHTCTSNSSPRPLKEHGSPLPGQIPPRQRLELPGAMGSGFPVFHLEGHEFHAIEDWQDTYNTTVLHVPSMRLVVAATQSTVTCINIFDEANTVEKRRGWLRALDTIEALDPHIAIAGHRRAGTIYELVSEMLRRYPNRINPHANL